MSDQIRAVAMLTILLATCETTLQAFAVAEHPLGEELRRDLERMVERTRAELHALKDARG